jgi:hypothetical protein
MMIKSLDYFAALVQQDDSIPLFEAALSIAQDIDPQLDLAAQQVEIDVLAAKLFAIGRFAYSETAHAQPLFLS